MTDRFNIPIRSGNDDADTLLKAYLWFDDDRSIERLGKVSLKLFGATDGGDRAKIAFFAAHNYLQEIVRLSNTETEGNA